MKHRTVYAAIGPANLAVVIASGWRRLGVDFPNQAHCYLKRDAQYAAQIARAWHASQYSAGYVVQLRVRETFLATLALDTIAYQDHLQYRLPAAELGDLARHCAGRIRVLHAYHSERRTLSLQRDIQWSQAL
ncbi:MAG TPA: hypothetical protein VL027_01110 [Spongiibacteraceae bacterium]|jgi:hypothetical protein|nr:hypothetical protein [Spongiibacteraceae bacterium]HUH36519.1 hypothetical protein [Spongiibacteraceae bacterium]